MTTSNGELLRAWFEEIWNGGDVDAADRLLAPTAVLHETAVGGDGTQRLADFKMMAHSFRRMFPDIRFQVQTIVEDREHAAGRLTVTGTHTGPGLGAPTGRPFRISGIVMIRIQDGRTVEGWSSFDLLALYEQLGMVQRPKMTS
jgi:steroid delta-isomerase-like uncharacterized protein